MHSHFLSPLIFFAYLFSSTLTTGLILFYRTHLHNCLFIHLLPKPCYFQHLLVIIIVNKSFSIDTVCLINSQFEYNLTGKLLCSASAKTATLPSFKHQQLHNCSLHIPRPKTALLTPANNPRVRRTTLPLRPTKTRPRRPPDARNT